MNTSSLLVALVALLAAVAAASWRWRRLAAREARIVLTGGGTGGHVNPCLAIAEGIRNREERARFLYVGARGKAETVIVERAGYPLVLVAATGFPGLRPSLQLLRFLAVMTLGIAKSTGILLHFAPRWIVASGGYVSAPILIAAILLRRLRVSPTRIFVHEQNSVPGQLNGLIGKWADRVLLTFPQTISFFPRNGVVVGYPVRQTIVLKAREEALANLPAAIPPGRRVVFLFGGSQGSRTINRGIVDALRYLLPHRERLFIIHGMGLAKSAAYDAVQDTEERLRASYSEEELCSIDQFYYRQDYFHNISDVYSISELIVCRSGAGSLNEISRLGKAALLIPKANLPGDHQVMNARAVKHAGAVEILFEDTTLEAGQVLERVEGAELAERILRLLQNPQRLTEMGLNSAKFLRRSAIPRIMSELYGDRSYDNGVGIQSAPLRPLFSNTHLLRVLEGAYRKAPQGYDPLTIVGDADDLCYYRHRAAALLTQSAWPERNLGVKLIGYTGYVEKIPTLLHMLADRTPVSRVQRFLGADFEQVGFIRRNIVIALQVMNHFDSDIDRHLSMALEDPYFEVRAHACHAAAHFHEHLAGNGPWLLKLAERLQDDSFEVVLEAARALGELGSDDHALTLLLGLHNNFHWQVRNAALHGIRRLLERRIISPSPELLHGISRFVLTATDFRPHFTIKETYKGLQDHCRRGVDRDGGAREMRAEPPRATGKY